jgi:hypothetical protein
MCLSDNTTDIRFAVQTPITTVLARIFFPNHGHGTLPPLISSALLGVIDFNEFMPSMLALMDKVAKEVFNPPASQHAQFLIHVCVSPCRM